MWGIPARGGGGLGKTNSQGARRHHHPHLPPP